MLYKVKVHADAKENRLERRGPDAFEVWVRAPAERGLANAAVLELLTAALGRRPRIVKGAQSPSKIVAV